MVNNGYFKEWDPAVRMVAGHMLDPNWWSRPYEYAWALGEARHSHIAADMGCGWMFRPFKDALANVCQFVYAVDADSRLLSQHQPPNMDFIVADITKHISRLPDRSIDRVFCISVLEDLNDMALPALQEFKRVLKDDGRIVLTFDMPFDSSRPTPVYPGMPAAVFQDALSDAGLKYVGAVDTDKANAVNHAEWNLCVFHCLLEKV
jgi:ubiquinone/menaquinone biosynthesis C-methylase UbiE